jgi:hypothetical protein
MPRLFSILLILASALVAHAGVQQIDFTGIGHIYVLQSNSWQTATPKQKVGCLDDFGKFVNDKTKACGTFSRLNEYPYTLSSKHGNCTFEDKTQPRNTDSIYGGADYAWNCQHNYKTEIYDELYTIVRISSSTPILSRKTVLTIPRTDSPTSSSASVTSGATTTPKKPHLSMTSCPSGNIVGARSRWASHRATYSCSCSGKKSATYPSAKANRRFRAPGSKFRRACRYR